MTAYTGMFRAVDFLESELGDGRPHPSAPIRVKARALRIRRPTLRRAARFVHVIERRHAVKGSRHTWQLPYIVGDANARAAGIEVDET